MLDLVLGESLEHARLFQQAAGGRLDLLGRRRGGERRSRVGVAADRAGSSARPTLRVSRSLPLPRQQPRRPRRLTSTSPSAASRELLADLRVSPFIDTEPVGVGPQPAFLNGAAVGLCAHGSPRDLLDALLAIEQDRGRERPHPGAPRTLDLDLILFGDLILSEPGLRVPHPRFRERRFVLEPLAAIAPDLVDPVTGLTVGELLARLGTVELSIEKLRM